MPTSNPPRPWSITSNRAASGLNDVAMRSALPWVSLSGSPAPSLRVMNTLGTMPPRSEKKAIVLLSGDQIGNPPRDFSNVTFLRAPRDGFQT